MNQLFFRWVMRNINQKSDILSFKTFSPAFACHLRYLKTNLIISPLAALQYFKPNIDKSHKIETHQALILSNVKVISIGVGLTLFTAAYIPLQPGNFK